jgi:nitrile hydratase
MGGMHGFGPIRPRQNEETFHAEWEKRVPGLGAVSGHHGVYNIDEFRHGIERMDPREYLAASYYERHLFTIETNLIEKGVLTGNEIEARLELLRRDPTSMGRRDDPALAERVVTRNVHTRGHTRLPRYARGKRGQIDRFQGIETLPDASAHGRGRRPEPLYSVRFDAAELWGASADGPGSVYLDLWESYLEPVEDERT